MPPLKGVTPHGVERCPKGSGDRSVRGGRRSRSEGFFRKIFYDAFNVFVGTRRAVSVDFGKGKSR